jgi:hypothetical protein
MMNAPKQQTKSKTMKRKPRVCLLFFLLLPSSCFFFSFVECLSVWLRVLSSWVVADAPQKPKTHEAPPPTIYGLPLSSLALIQMRCFPPPHALIMRVLFCFLVCLNRCGSRFPQTRREEQEPELDPPPGPASLSPNPPKQKTKTKKTQKDKIPPLFDTHTHTHPAPCPAGRTVHYNCDSHPPHQTRNSVGPLLFS